MIVITGASGQLGSLVANQLKAHGDPAHVTLASRTPEKLVAYADAGFRTAHADFDDPASLDTAFAGAGTLLLISADGPDDVRIVQHGSAIDAAKRAGVKRLVYTSFQNASADSLCPLNRLHAATEALIRESGLSHVLLRNGQYAENLALSIPQALQHGALAQPGTAGKVAYVSRGDIAAATAAVLAGAGNDDATYELAGPEALSAIDIADQLSTITGRSIPAVDMAPDDFGAMLGQAGLPPFMIDAMLGLFAANAAGEFASTSQDIERLTGRPAAPASALLAALAG